MISDPHSSPTPEEDFARSVDAWDSGPARQRELLALLDEAHPVYRQRSTSATTRMRGWTLLVLARQTLPAAATVYVLEDLQTGRTAYGVACAAKALRSVPHPTPAMAGVIVQAAANIRGTDDYVDLDRYGGATDEDNAVTASDELMTSLIWLGATVSGVIQVLEAALNSDAHGLSSDQVRSVEGCLGRLRIQEQAPSSCCGSPLASAGFRRWLPRRPGDAQDITFEDQDGNRLRYTEFFTGRPTIVVFFYTRCDNAGKCSLTVSKLARIQSMLADHALGHRVQTAAITYDADFDLAPRLRGYAESRGAQMSTSHRVMRTIAGADELRAHFALGVSFIGSIVNRHRIEAYIVDEQGAISASFTRLQWDERQVMDEALALLEEARSPSAAVSADRAPSSSSSSSSASQSQSQSQSKGSMTSSTRQALAPLIYLMIAVLPKCPICGATYLSVSGIMALPHLPALYWMVPALSLLTIVNLASLAWLARTTKDWRGLAIASMGAAITLIGGVASENSAAFAVGITVTLAGSLLGVSRNSFIAVRQVLARPHSSINPRTWTGHGMRTRWTNRSSRQN